MIRLLTSWLDRRIDARIGLATAPEQSAHALKVEEREPEGFADLVREIETDADRTRRAIHRLNQRASHARRLRGGRRVVRKCAASVFASSVINFVLARINGPVSPSSGGSITPKFKSVFARISLAKPGLSSSSLATTWAITWWSATFRALTFVTRLSSKRSTSCSDGGGSASVESFNSSSIRFGVATPDVARPAAGSLPGALGVVFRGSAA